MQPLTASIVALAWRKAIILIVDDVRVDHAVRYFSTAADHRIQPAIWRQRPQLVDGELFKMPVIMCPAPDKLTYQVVVLDAVAR